MILSKILKEKKINQNKCVVDFIEKIYKEKLGMII